MKKKRPSPQSLQPVLRASIKTAALACVVLCSYSLSNAQNTPTLYSAQNCENTLVTPKVTKAVTPDQTVLIVGAYSSGIDLPKELIQRGFTHVIHVHTGEKIPEAVHAFDASLFEKDFFYTGKNTAELIQILKDKNIGAVIAGSELSIEGTDLLTQLLHLPGNDPEFTATRRNKWLMQNRLKELGIPSIPSLLTRDANEAIQWVKNERNDQWPVVVKPIHGAGADGVHFCLNEQQLRTAFKKLLDHENLFKLKNDKILVQAEVKGTEYAVNFVSKDGIHVAAELWRYKKKQVDLESGGKNNVYEYVDLVPLNSEVSKQLFPYAEKVLNAFGVQNGASHIEIMMTHEGPVLIEMGARLMGGRTHLMTREAQGQSAIDLLLTSITHPQDFFELHQLQKLGQFSQFQKHARLVLFVSEQTGTIEKVNTELFSAMPSLQQINLMKPGESVTKTIDMQTSPGDARLVHSDLEVLNRDYDLLMKNENNIYKLSER